MSDTTTDNFLSAAQLHCSEEERDALIQTLALFESGKVPHNPHPASRTNLTLPKELSSFNMQYIAENTECGAVGCILGWARYLSNDTHGYKIFRDLWKLTKEQAALFNIVREGNESKMTLYWHRPDNLFTQDITTEHAAVALRTYLETGTPNWKEAFK